MAISLSLTTNPLTAIILLLRVPAAVLHRPGLVPTPAQGTGGSSALSYHSRPLVQSISPLTPRLPSPHSFISALLRLVTWVDLHQRLRSNLQTEENNCQILSTSPEALQNMHRCRNSILEADKHHEVWMQSFLLSVNVI